MKPGYKRTDVGILPIDWDAEPLGKIGESLIGLTYRPDEVRAQGTLVLRSSNIQEDDLRFDDNVFVRAEIPERLMVQPDDILVCVRNGSRDLIGKSALIDDRAKGMTFGAFMAIFRSPKGRFLHYVFQSAILKRQINAHLGATINQITNKSLNSFRVPSPPTEDEMRSIAAVLGDVDSLLKELTRLIAKRRDLKQAALQRLFTGQTRLPGFGGKWVEKRLGDALSKIIGGGTPSRSNPSYWGNEIPWVTVKDFSVFHPRQTVEMITRAGLASCASSLIPAGTLIISTRMALGRAAIYEVDVAINQDLKALILKPNTDTLFLYYWFQKNLRRIVELGSGSTVKGISIGELGEIPFPSLDISEQIAIASVLSDMDAELAVLERRRDKTRALKQAMMQELLTGKTRLVPGEAVRA